MTIEEDAEELDLVIDDNIRTCDALRYIDVTSCEDGENDRSEKMIF